MFVQSDLAIQVLFGQILEVFQLLGVIDIHFGHGGVQDGFATSCYLLVFLVRT